MNIKLIASDIDGTIINESREVTDVTKEVIQSLKEQGIHFALITGRGYEGGIDIARKLDIDKEGYGLICLNGLETYNLPNPHPIRLETMPFEEAKKIGEYGHKFYMGVLYCFEDEIYMEMDDITYRDYKISLNEDKLRFFNERLKTNLITSVDEIKDKFEKEPLQKVVFIQSDSFMELLHERIDEGLGEEYHALMVGKGWVEIMPDHISKGNAIIEYAKTLGISPDEIMVFGDAENDISMFKSTGNGVAMANAMDSLKKHAKETTLTNDENGVAVHIQKCLQKGIHND